MSDGPVRVVIADDDDSLRLLLQLQLDELPDVEVVGVAATGGEAVELCRQTGPDAAVLDLRLPDIQGAEVIERLQAECPDVALVAYSAAASPNAREDLDRLGVPLVIKGDPDELVRLLVAGARERGSA